MQSEEEKCMLLLLGTRVCCCYMVHQEEEVESLTNSLTVNKVILNQLIDGQQGTNKSMLLLHGTRESKGQRWKKVGYMLAPELRDGGREKMADSPLCRGEIIFRREEIILLTL